MINNSTETIDIDGYSFFMNKLTSDKDYATEIKSMIQYTSKKEIREDINKLREDINQKLSPPKIYISVKHLEDFYSISESQQKNLRGRVNNPLPFYQDGQGGKIRYKVSEVDEWMNQQKVKRGI